MNRRRLRDWGIAIGELPTGPHNKLSDVPGVTVGHATVADSGHNTGLTVILPASGNLYADKLIAASHIINGYGKTAGSIQLDELGTLETPIALTGTLNVGKVSDALVAYTMAECDRDGVACRSVNPVVGETNDAVLNRLADRPVGAAELAAAIADAGADFDEGDVGAGRGTMCMGLKGGIGSASRIVTVGGQHFTLGALVQTNFGRLDDLLVAGYPAGAAIRRIVSAPPAPEDKGSCMIIIGTDLPVSHRQLSRILRRAARHAKLLGITHAFLSDLCEVVIEQNITAYPELGEKRAYIKKVIAMEEERFDATIDAGLSILSGIIEKAEKSGAKVIAGEDVFKLYDTFGFPLDLTKEILAEKGLSADEEAFSSLMKAQRERARAARGNISGWDNSTKGLLDHLPKTVFCGYDGTGKEGAKILAILAETDDGVQSVPEIAEGECTVVLDTTPFYGEGGGQVGDTGVLTAGEAQLAVQDTKKTDGIYLHICTVKNGIFHVGDTVNAVVDNDRRMAIARNHSAAHLLQAALRSVLGTHVEQAGSYVDPDKCRFDFTHFAALTKEELEKVEALVNEQILAGLPITMTETELEQAKKMGAMALFGEKYGKMVRVVRMGDFSIEFCGGTHIDNTAKIGLFKIISETSVAAGVRRVEATTGYGILSLLAERDALLAQTATALKAQNPHDVAKRAAAVEDELKALTREVEALNAKLASSKKDDVLKNVIDLGKVKLTTARFDGMKMEIARSLADEIKAEHDDLVALLAVCDGDRVQFLAVAGKAAVAAGAHAGKLVGAVAAVTGGKGGGRPDNAMAGGKDTTKVEAALAAAKEILAAQLG